MAFCEGAKKKSKTKTQQRLRRKEKETKIEAAAEKGAGGSGHLCFIVVAVVSGQQWVTPLSAPKREGESSEGLIGIDRR